VCSLSVKSPEAVVVFPKVFYFFNCGLSGGVSAVALAAIVGGKNDDVSGAALAGILITRSMVSLARSWILPVFDCLDSIMMFFIILVWFGLVSGAN